MSEAPILAVSMGDPAGVGPEVVVKAASVKDVNAELHLVVYGDVEVLARAAREMAPTVTVQEVSSPKEAAALPLGQSVLPVIKCSELEVSKMEWGQQSPASDAAQLTYIQAAFDGVWKGGADALVTAPVNKAGIKSSGADFSGHTELLARLTGSGKPVMMLAGPTLKVVPLTTHVALRDVAGLIDQELIVHGIEVTHEAFRRFFNRKQARIAVAGLNPHAGDGGLFGDEEANIIEPAIETARAKGISVFGPLPGDSVFHRAVAGEFDVVLGMYHDQALVPLKLLDFDHAVNVTLGLPMVRTSVDHGTAYDIAGRGVASASSMITALRLAARMVRDTQPAEATTVDARKS